VTVDLTELKMCFTELDRNQLIHPIQGTLSGSFWSGSDWAKSAEGAVDVDSAGASQTSHSSRTFQLFPRDTSPPLVINKARRGDHNEPRSPAAESSNRPSSSMSDNEHVGRCKANRYYSASCNFRAADWCYIKRLLAWLR